ncbi:MAG TPA: DUF5678 domain-containing protein [Patescibacteria group bacterium]|jgi:hypothetical protein|nr:DUF5678 domain-containing protein [Patescibacteria group bacterium]
MSVRGMEDSQILEILKKSEGDSKWVSEEYDKLRTKYEGKVFAVRNKTVLSHADTAEELVKKLENMGEDIGFVLIETIPRRDLSFIL